MSLRLQQYRRKKARGELRNDLAYPLVVFALSAVFLAGYGLLNLGSPLCWAALSGAVVLTTVGYGMYRCRRWARWPPLIPCLCLIRRWRQYRRMRRRTP